MSTYVDEGNPTSGRGTAASGGLFVEGALPRHRCTARSLPVAELPPSVFQEEICQKIATLDLAARAGGQQGGRPCQERTVFPRRSAVGAGRWEDERRNPTGGSSTVRVLSNHVQCIKRGPLLRPQQDALGRQAGGATGESQPAKMAPYSVETTGRLNWTFPPRKKFRNKTAGGWLSSARFQATALPDNWLSPSGADRGDLSSGCGSSKRVLHRFKGRMVGSVPGLESWEWAGTFLLRRPFSEGGLPT
jgi:hypothetical protein